MSVWTPQASLRLEELYSEGRSASIIANHLAREGLINVSRSAVIGRAHRLRLPPRIARKSQQVRSKEDRRERDNALRKVRRQRARMTIVVIEPEPAPEHQPAPRYISLYKLRHRSCRYPFGESPYSFCGHLTVRNSSFCPYHHKLCYGRER